MLGRHVRAEAASPVWCLGLDGRWWHSGSDGDDGWRVDQWGSGNDGWRIYQRGSGDV